MFYKINIQINLNKRQLLTHFCIWTKTTNKYFTCTKIQKKPKSFSMQSNQSIIYLTESFVALSTPVLFCRRCCCIDDPLLLLFPLYEPYRFCCCGGNIGLIGPPVA